MSQPTTNAGLIWSETVGVRSHETDMRERWKPYAFFQAMQEAATHHAASLGFGYRRMLDMDRIWILSRAKVRFERFPRLGDEVSILTFPRGIQQKLFFIRDFEFTGASGERYAVATTAWILISPSERRILPQAALSLGFPFVEGRAALDEPLEKINPPANLPECLSTKAGYSAVDLMGHVNNARYVEWACDAFPHEMHAERDLEWLQVNYVNEVKAGEGISVAAGEDPAAVGLWRVCGTNANTGQRAFDAALQWR